MAYDRYDTRGGSRERWRSSDDRFRDRERGHSGREERGFFERAGDEVASWFGDEEAERRRRQDEMMRERERGYGRDFDRERGVGGGYGREGRFSDWQRGRPERFEDEDRGPLSAASYRGYSGESGYRPSMWGSERDRERDPERGYRPLTGDYGRNEGLFAAGGQPRGGFAPRDWESDEQRRSTGQRDPHYESWRRRQLDELDRDYDEYRRENQSKFESEFGTWRERRMQKRGLLGQIREHMEVVGSDEQHVGTIDRVAGDRIILTKSDPEAGGVHHSLSCSDIDRVEGDRVILDLNAEQAKLRWRDESRERALFEREDQGEMGPRMLDRSFSGTYR